MAQEVKLVARTFEIDTVSNVSGFDSQDITDATSDEMKVLSGKAAGVCYMPDDYFENGVQDEEKARKRAEMTSKSGHHSVFDHGHLTFVIKTNKMMAMILNSLGVYTTSEKSARYTKMQPETELELQLYNKWKAKIQELILAKYPDTDDAELRKRFIKWFKEHAGERQAPPRLENGTFTYCMDDACWDKLEELKKSDTLPSMKLAMENARYMISVFTPTTMMYTVSYRQMCLTINYLHNLAVNLEHSNEDFDKKLLPYVKELEREFRDIAGNEAINDNKNQHIRFLEGQHLGDVVRDKEEKDKFIPFKDATTRFIEKSTVIGDSYTVVYNGSLAMLAQAQRHRTLRYTMYLNKKALNKYYVPPIVEDAGLDEDWLKDIESVAYCIPQGTMVRITEQGLFEDFALKCKERMCGRAQLEIMKSTAWLVNLFSANSDKLCYANRELLNNITIEVDDSKMKEACARCQFKDFKCTEGCQWGAKNALSRLI